MKAIVCDCCGKVILIPDRTNTYDNTGVHRLITDSHDECLLDLCDKCAENLMKAVRKE